MALARWFRGFEGVGFKKALKKKGRRPLARSTPPFFSQAAATLSPQFLSRKSSELVRRAGLERAPDVADLPVLVEELVGVLFFRCCRRTRFFFFQAYFWVRASVFFLSSSIPHSSLSIGCALIPTLRSSKKARANPGGGSSNRSH